MGQKARAPFSVIKVDEDDDDSFEQEFLAVHEFLTQSAATCAFVRKEEGGKGKENEVTSRRWQ